MKARLDGTVIEPEEAVPANTLDESLIKCHSKSLESCQFSDRENCTSMFVPVPFSHVGVGVKSAFRRNEPSTKASPLSTNSTSKEPPSPIAEFV